jgi:hypothetical protein
MLLSKFKSYSHSTLFWVIGVEKQHEICVADFSPIELETLNKMCFVIVKI